MELPESDLPEPLRSILAPAAGPLPTPSVRASGDPLFGAAQEFIAAVFERASVCESHGLAHAQDVARIAGGALAAHPGLDEDRQLEVLLAALLHDADDRKFFPRHDDCQNARACLAAVGLEAARAERVVRMIGWVSAAKNGDSIPPEAAENPWMLYPRHADRLATSGWTGVYRCWKYTEGVGRPLYTAATPRAAGEDELWERLATPERNAAYRGDSASMMDHYYDKLLRQSQRRYDNPYLAAESARRARPLVEVALLYGRTGSLPAGLFDLARLAAEKECAT